MRKIGVIEKSTQASVFSDYLYAKGIANTVEPVGGNGFEIWVHDEDMCVSGREALARYLNTPDHSDFSEASQIGAERRREDALTTNRNPRWKIFGFTFLQGMSVTRLLIVLSLVATVFGGLGSGARLTQVLSITKYKAVEGHLTFDRSLPEIKHGEVWRLLTPIFLHATLLASYGILHLLFNMLWLRDLGGMLERAQGSSGLLIKVVIIGIVSNFIQFIIGGPAFGGMSGVVYGLLGYIWLRGRLDLTSGLYVSGQTMMMMTLWFFLCLSGTMGAIANAAHAGGLFLGVTWGWLAARRVNARR